MKQRTLTTKLFAAFALIAALAACAPKQDSGSNVVDSASRETGTSTATRPLANCNKVQSSSVTLNIMTYPGRFDLLQGKLTSMTETFLNKTDYIRFFRWKTDANGAKSLDTTAIKVRLHAEGSGQQLTQYEDFLRWDQVSAYAASISVTSAADFYSRVRLLMDIRDPNADYDALTMVYYDGSNQILNQTDILIPTFTANPNDYAVEPSGAARPSILRNLHPFAAITGQTANYYQTQANAFCFGQ